MKRRKSYSLSTERWRRVAPTFLLFGLGGCWQIGEPAESPALVTWAAYPETVRVGDTFPFEFAGPVAPTTCGRLDTAWVTVTDSSIRLGARRSTFEALCARQRVAFYEARPLALRKPGRYAIRTEEGRQLGALVAEDSGRITPMRAVGDGTVKEVGGCWLFGPGWIGNQRPFALRGAPEELLREAGDERILRVEGTLAGFVLCGWYGSRPAIRVDTAWLTGETTADYYGS